MSARPEAPDDFLDWARQRQSTGEASLAALPPITASSFLPRAVYGEYLEEHLAAARWQAVRGVTFNHVIGEVVDLYHNGHQAHVMLQSGRVVTGDQVVLALGVLPSEYPVQRPLKFFNSRRYVHFAWSPDRWRGLEEGDDVLLVGRGLRAWTWPWSWRIVQRQGRIYLLSRRGFRPKEHRWEPPWPEFLHKENLPRTVRETVQAVRAQIHQPRRAAGAMAGAPCWTAFVR